jgi:hypothetical protein
MACTDWAMNGNKWGVQIKLIKVIHRITDITDIVIFSVHYPRNVSSSFWVSDKWNI